MWILEIFNSLRMAVQAPRIYLFTFEVKIISIKAKNNFMKCCITNFIYLKRFRETDLLFANCDGFLFFHINAFDMV